MKKYIWLNRVFAILIVCSFLFGLLPVHFPIENVSATSLHWWNASWSCRKLITIDHTKVASMAAKLYNYPIMVNTTDGDLKSNAQFDGDDICFVLYSDNSTQLHHEIESYTSNNGGLLAWVNVTTLSSSVDMKIWMYYGNDGCSSQQNRGGTWNGNYLAVYHMNGSSYATCIDSTSHANNPTGKRGGPTYQQKIAGSLGYCVYFDGTDDSILLPQVYTGGTPATNYYTISGWIEPSGTTGGNQFVLNQYNAGVGMGLIIDSTGTTAVSNINGSTFTTIAITNGHFHYLTSRKDATKVYTFKNTSIVADITSFKPSYAATVFNISDRPTSGREFKGYVDEVRLSNISRNDTWLKCDYNTTSSPSTFFSVGSEERYSPWVNSAPVQINESPVNGTTAVSIPVHLSIAVSDTDTNQTMTLSWRSNSSGSWVEFGHNNTVTAGTYRMIATNFTGYTTKYWWNLTLKDSYGKYTNATYHLTTHAPASVPVVTTNATTNIGNTNATLNMWLQNCGGTVCRLWFNCTEYHPAITSGTGSTISAKWTRNIYSGTTAMSAAKDTNGDGVMELYFAGAIPGSGNTVANICSLNGSSGAIIWSRNISCAGGYVDSHLPICIADFLDDGRSEMVFPFNTHTMCLWCSNGTTMWNVAVYSGYHQPLVYDVDHNGHPYVYVDGYISGTPASYYMWMLYGRNGTVRAVTTGTTASVSDGGVSAGDPSRNGTIRIYTSQQLQCWDENLTSLKWVSSGVSSSSMAPTLFDYDHNGFLEILMTYSASSSCAVWLYNATSGSLIYTNASTGMGGHHNPGLYDFNNDGHYEMATSYNVMLPKIWDVTARRVDWTYPLSHGISESPMYANVIGDDALEMLICDSWTTGYISIFNTTYAWKQNVSGIFLNCMVWDVDGDGYNEIIGYRTQATYSTITCFDTQAYAPVLRERGDTPFYGENKLNTALYTPELNRKLVAGKTNCTWSQKLYGLTPGTAYFSQAAAQNSNGTSYGSKSVFLTKPNPPLSLATLKYHNSFKLNWTKGTGANTTYIERNTVAVWSHGAGTMVYNGTGIFYNDTNILPFHTYYYQLWSYTKKSSLQQWSDLNQSASVTTNNTIYPGARFNVDNEYYGAGPSSFIVDNASSGTDWVSYNGLGFNVTSSSTIYINISSLASHPKSISTNNSLLIAFNASSLIGSSVTFTINGLQPSQTYRLHNDSSLNTLTSSVSGVLSFSRSSWTTHSYGIYYSSSGTTPPAVTTNASTSIGFTTSTLNGFVRTQLNSTYGFHYGLTSSYGSNHTVGTYLPLGWVASTCRPTSGYKYQVTTTSTPWDRMYDGSNDSYTGVDVSQTDKWGVFNFTASKCIDRVYFYYEAHYTHAPYDYIYITQVNVTNGTGWSTAWTGTKTWMGNTTTQYLTFPQKYNVTQMRIKYSFTVHDHDRLWEMWCRNYTYFGAWYNSTFNYPLTSLLPGNNYHYRAWAINYLGLSLGDDFNFTTKPYAPTAQTTTTVYSKLSLSWSKGDGANYTRIQMNSTGGTYPTTNTTGTNKYNDTGTNTIISSLKPGMRYEFSLWSYAVWGSNHKWSSNYTTTYGLTRPEAPTATKLYIPGNLSYLQINYTKGTGANNTVIRKKTTGYPTGPTDGTLVGNTTLTYARETIEPGVTYYYKAWSYTHWTTPAIHAYSYNGTTISTNGTYGGIWIYCYNETNGIPLKFNCTIVNKTGTQTYVAYNKTNPLVLNASLMPKGTGCSILINAQNHRQRQYYLDIYTGIFYLLKAYLPYTVTPRPPGNNSYLYYLHVTETITAQGQTATVNNLKDVNLYMKALVNGTYQVVSTLKTDAAGLVPCWLIPYKFYKVELNKTGYVEGYSDYIPQPPNQYDQTTTQEFSMISIATNQSMTPLNSTFYNEVITFNGYIDRTTHIIYVNYTDALSLTIDAQIWVYEFNSTTNTSGLWASNLTMGDSDIYPSFPGASNFNTYTVVLCHNHTTFGYNTQMFMIGIEIIRLTTPSYTNRLWNANYGANPFGWSNVIMWLVMVLLIFYGGREELPLVFISIGVIFEFVNFEIGFFSWSTAAAATMIPLMFILSGILVAWYRYRG